MLEHSQSVCNDSPSVPSTSYGSVIRVFVIMISDEMSTLAKDDSSAEIEAKGANHHSCSFQSNNIVMYVV